MFNRFFSQRRKVQQQQRDHELAALRAAIKAEVLEEVRSLISLRQVSVEGVPNLNELQFALRNINAANLSIKYFGYELGRKLASTLPARGNTEARSIAIETKLSTQADIESEWVAHWSWQLQVPVIYHRKLWELAYVLQAIFQYGLMCPGNRGLGFGCGEEPVASFLASRGVQVTVTDLDADRAALAGWADTGQHTASLDKAFHAHLVDRRTFDKLVCLEYTDMNAIPEHLSSYDFCWSICSLEHLGSINAGLEFIKNSLNTIHPGGIAIHTTEFNIDSEKQTIDNWPTVLFQRQHFQALADSLQAKGHIVAPLNFDLGTGPMDRFVDVPPWIHDVPTDHLAWHGKPQVLKLALDGFISTCVGIVVQKAL